MKSSEGFVRMRTLQGVVLFIFLLIASRLAYIQLVDSKYNELAKANVLRHVVQYPPRGEVFDRNGEYLVQSRECYDLMVIYSEIDKHGLDTVRMCDVLGLSRGKLEKELANARMRPRAPRVVTNYISKEDKLRFDECNFRGFYTVYRTVRRYPRKIGGNLLGYVSEVNADYLKRNPEYKIGDYVGMGGVESAYEPLLRGTKGVKIQEIDTHGAIKGSYMNGVYDSLPEPGKYIVSTIPPATAGRRTHARQGRGGRGDRTFHGGDPDDGFLADVRSRRAGGARARQQLYEDAGQQTPAVV